MFEGVLFSRLLEVLISGPVFRDVRERSTAKSYRPFSLLSVVSKLFEKLVNNRPVDHMEKIGLLSDFQYGFRSSRSIADLLIVVSDRIARVFNWYGTTQAVALDISEAFDRVWHAVLLQKASGHVLVNTLVLLVNTLVLL